MFSNNFKLTVVNPDKNIVKITPTVGTIVKAFAPSLVLGGAILVGSYVAERRDQKYLNADTDED